MQHLDGKRHSRYYAPYNWENGKFQQHGEEVYGSDYDSDFLIAFMKRNKHRPFLAYDHESDPRSDSRTSQPEEARGKQIPG